MTELELTCDRHRDEWYRLRLELSRKITELEIAYRAPIAEAQKAMQLSLKAVGEAHSKKASHPDEGFLVSRRKGVAFSRRSGPLEKGRVEIRRAHTVFSPTTRILPGYGEPFVRHVRKCGKPGKRVLAHIYRSGWWDVEST